VFVCTGAVDGDGYLLKLNKEFKPVWWQLFTGSSNQELFNIRSLGNDLIVAGSAVEAENNLFSVNELHGLNDIVLVKYSQEGNILEKNIWGGANSELIRGALATDKYNNIYVGAHSLSTIFSAENTVTTFSKASYNVVIYKYNNHSQIEKSIIFEGNQGDQLRQLSIYNNHLYAFVYSNSSDLKIGAKTYSSPSSTYYSTYLVKMDLDLNVIDSKQFYATLGANCSHGCFSIDDNENIFVNLFFSGVLTFDSQSITASGVNNAMMVMVDKNFKVINQIQVPSSISSGFFTRLNKDGKYWIGAGVFNTSLNFLGKQFTSSGATDAFIFKTPR
jgi:uncharacterized protein YuzE